MPVPSPDRFVVEQWRALLPTAYLLTGSDGAARELLARGLARPGPGEDDRSRAVTGLVRAHLRRRVRGEGTVTGTSATPWWSSPADVESARATAAALDRLTPAERTAVVLRRHEGLPADRVTALVPGVDPDAAEAGLGGDLPARLDVLAGQCDTSVLTDGTAALEVAGVRSRRWRRAGLAVAVAAALAVGTVVLPDVLPDPAPAPEPAAGLTTTVRGSLAGDADLLAAALEDTGPPSVDLGRDPAPPEVVYAGDVDGVRAVVLLQQGDGGAAVIVRTGPAGTPVQQLATTTSADSGVPAVIAVGLTADPTGPADTVLVLTTPGDEIEVSPGLDVLPDGTAARTFTPVELDEEGVGVVPVRSDARAARVRVVRDDEVLRTAPPVANGGPLVELDAVDGAETAPPDGPDSRSGDPAVSAVEVDLALDPVTAATGWLPTELAVTVLGAGTYPQAGGTTADAVTLAAVLPGGAVVTTTAWATFGAGSISTGRCGSTGHPPGTDPATLTVAARCSAYAGDGSTFGVTVLVAAPPGVAVQLSPAAGGATVDVGLTRGWGYVIADAEALTGFAADGALGTVSREGADLLSS